MQYVVGIDEAGRGPLAGPVAVGVAVVPVGFDWSQIPGVTDSKALSERERERIFRLAHELRHHQALQFAVAMVGSSVIDGEGIVPAVNQAMDRALLRLGLLSSSDNAPRAVRPSAHTYETMSECSVKLDGGLRAPECFTQQETIIKGDAKEPVIGLASILAKVTRDHYMERIARRYTTYGFAEHKGYGTKAHRAAIAQYGKSPIHRTSYCQNIRSVV